MTETLETMNKEWKKAYIEVTQLRSELEEAKKTIKDFVIEYHKDNKDYDKLQKENEELKKQLSELKDTQRAFLVKIYNLIRPTIAIDQHRNRWVEIMNILDDKIESLGAKNEKTN